MSFCKINLADSVIKPAMKIYHFTIPLLKKSYPVLIFPTFFSVKTFDHFKGKTGMIYFFLIYFSVLKFEHNFLLVMQTMTYVEDQSLYSYGCWNSARISLFLIFFSHNFNFASSGGTVAVCTVFNTKAVKKRKLPAITQSNCKN